MHLPISAHPSFLSREPAGSEWSKWLFEVSLPRVSIPQPPIPADTVQDFLPINTRVPMIFTFVSSGKLDGTIPTVTPIITEGYLLSV